MLRTQSLKLIYYENQKVKMKAFNIESELTQEVFTFLISIFCSIKCPGMTNEDFGSIKIYLETVIYFCPPWFESAFALLEYKRCPHFPILYSSGR